jgi:hypothetical protein
VNLITATNLRRLIPASAVAAVLAFSWLSPQPSFASSGGTGYNCGVKGIGYHDHGKVCPNRPFPGQGNGLVKLGIDSTTPPATSATVKVTVTNGTTGSGSTPTSEGNSGTSGKSQSHRNGHGHAKGHSKN